MYYDVLCIYVFMYYADESVIFSHSFLLTVSSIRNQSAKTCPLVESTNKPFDFFWTQSPQHCCQLYESSFAAPLDFLWKTSFLKIVRCAWDSQCLWRMHSQPPNISRWIQEIGMLLCTKLLLMHRPAQSWRYHLIASCWSSRWTRPDCWWLFYSQRELVMENACII